MSDEHSLISAEGLSYWYVLSAGYPAITPGGVSYLHERGTPIVFGLVVQTAGLNTDPSRPAIPMMFASDLEEAGRLIAAIELWAERRGMSAALRATTDQGRAWAKASPDET